MFPHTPLCATSCFTGANMTRTGAPVPHVARLPLAMVAFALLISMWAPSSAQAQQSLTFSGRMGSKALLVIDGQPKVLGVGEEHNGVKLLEVTGEQARVERDGQALGLRLGAAPTSLASSGDRPGASRDIELKADAGGHFVSEGWINGKATRFMVDTGATAVTLGQAEAERLGLDWRRAPAAQANTANGPVPAHSLQLGTVRIGELSVNNVVAVVLPSALPHVLLGNSFLSRVNMKRENDTLRLEPRAGAR